MNNLWKNRKTRQAGKHGVKNLVISIVILVELLSLCAVGTFAWVETVSSIKITNEANTVGTVGTYVFTEAMIGDKSGTIDLADYFKASGDIHLAPASSADGETFYFPKANATTVYRKGNVSDKNTTYLSATFKLQADTNADFFFTATPAISVSDDIRVSVTTYSEGSTDSPVTKIYANNASTAAVVNSTTGATGTTAVEKFTDHQKGKSSTYRLFAVGANETKIVTINVWLQKKASGNTDLTSNMSASQAINNLGITSSLTPRHVTLLPTPTWDNSGATYYAWCWGATNGASDRLYKLELDDNEHYGFDYNGTYQNTTFVRAVPGCTVAAGTYSSWPFSSNTASNTDGYWNQTVDTAIPNDPVDPTYVIETINEGTDSKSTGSWINPVTVNLAYITGQTSDWGTLAATSYVGTTTSTHVIEETNSSSTKHIDTVHAWPGKLIQLKATAKTNYRFVGWYDNAGTVLSTSATYSPTAPSTGGDEITYYAKFVETRTLTIYKYVDGSASTTAAGTITIGSNTSSSSVSSYSQTYDKGTSVSFSATAATGYTLSGIYTTATGTTVASSPVTLDSNTSYYARFTTNSYNVSTRPCYTDTVGGTSFTISNTGGKVKTGTGTQTSGSTTTSTQSVKYKSTVTLSAEPATGYGFVGWYTGQSSGTLLSTDTEYTYTLDSASAQTVYGRFMKLSTTTIYVTPRENWGDDYYVRLYDSSGDNISSSDSSGFVKADYDSSTGYYKATFSSAKTGTFYAILAKDTNYTSQVPTSGGYSGTLGSSYRFKKGTEGIATYNNERCIWFIDGTSSQWIVSDCNLASSSGGTLIRSYYTSLTTMTKINSNCWIYEYSGLKNGDSIYFNQNYKNNDTYEKNHWQATLTDGKNQYTATGGAGHDNYGAGSWTN